MAKSGAESIERDDPPTSTSLPLPPDEPVTASLSPNSDEDPSSTATPVREGDVLSGKYRVEGVIGGGGMGVVFSAQHLQLQTRVALKVLRPDVATRGFAVARLLREARASARIQGEHAVRVLDIDTLDTGTPYIVMEHLTGRDLRMEIRVRGPLAVATAVEYLLHACEAVAQAHAAGIVHRDLKPSNLFLTQRTDGSPCVKVLDFGIAKALDGHDGGDDGGDDASLTSSRAILGSPMYMSPEQIRSAKAVDQRTDVWSLGLILFELLTAQRPFTGSSAASRLAATAADAPIALRRLRREAPAELEEVILRCLEKDVARRTPSVAALARELAPFAPARAAGSIERVEAALRGSLAPTAGDRPSVAIRRRGRGARGRAALFAGVAVVVGVPVAYGLRSARSHEPAGRREAEDAPRAPEESRAAEPKAGVDPSTAVPSTAVPSTAVPSTAVPSTAVPSTAPQRATTAARPALTPAPPARPASAAAPSAPPSTAPSSAPSAAPSASTPAPKKSIFEDRN